MPVSARTPPASLEIGRSVFRNTSSNFVGKFIALATGFLLTPFLLAKIGPATYGLWMLVASVLSYASIDLGLSSTIIKYTAEYHAKNEERKAASLIATALWTYSILGGIVLISCL